jgi:8-oxo-dGTP diphosphatase/2-hydroxy-dATP diphosphatase
VKDVTNMYIVKDNKVLLGLKRRGFGAGKWNGFGGKLKEDETIEEAALRECNEECGLIPTKYYKAGIIDFGESYQMIDHVYICTSFVGTPFETEEMTPKWFSFDEIPYDSMWADDIYWLPILLSGKKFKATFIFENDTDLTGTNENRVISYSLKEVDDL